ncbi:serine protease [Caballeronia sp. LjRoot29]|uniref:S1 family peptidase n=1 Tax=Caballeronia sp. LjRoot29 TaxID=3342315 RepID=UPI003ECE6A78
MISLINKGVAEVRCHTYSNYGSGFLLGNGLVLTARHVLAPDNGDTIPDDLSIEVRLAATKGRSQPWSVARLAWPLLPNELTEEPDIALLQITEGPLAQTVAPLIHLMGADAAADMILQPTHKAVAIGLPNLAMEDDIRETEQITAVIELGRGLVLNKFNFNKLQFGGAGANTFNVKDDWHGFSGAALFITDAKGRDSLPWLAGVIVTYERNDSYEFGAVRIGALLDDENATRLLEPLFKPGEQAPERPSFAKLVCLLDRKDQEQQFVASYRRASRSDGASASMSRASRPTIILLPGSGEARHEPLDFGMRLNGHTLVEHLQWPAPQPSMRLLHWPTRVTDPEEAIARLRDELWNELSGKGDPPKDAAAYAQIMHDTTQPRFFVSDNLAGLDYPLNDASASVLRTWSSFWAGFVGHGIRAPIHLVCLNSDYEVARRWMVLANCHPDVHLDVLPELSKCQSSDLAGWLSVELRKRVSRTYESHIDRLESKLEDLRFKGNFFLRELKSSVAKFMNEDNRG